MDESQNPNDYDEESFFAAGSLALRAARQMWEAGASLEEIGADFGRILEQMEEEYGD